MDLALIEVLLRRYGRLILPELGAFLVNNFENGYEHQNVSFSPFLRYNDGKFEQYLELDYSMPRDQARMMVAAYTEQIRSLLDTSKQCFIPAIGTLLLNYDGQITLQLEENREVSSVTSREGNDTLSLDIPLDNQAKYIVLDPSQASFSIPDETHFEQKHDNEISSEAVSEASSTKQDTSSDVKSAFSLGGAFTEVSYNTTKEQDTITQPIVEDDSQTETATGFALGGSVIATATTVSGFEVNDCLNALEAYKTANETKNADDIVCVADETDLDIPPEVLLNESLNGVQPAIDAEESQGTSSVNVETFIGATVRHNTVPRSKQNEAKNNSPWISPKTTQKKKPRGIIFLILFLLILVALLADVLWFKQATPYFVDFLESKGILLRERPSVEVSIDGQSQVATTQIGINELAGATSGIESDNSQMVNKPVTSADPSDVNTISEPQSVITGLRFYLVLGCFRNRDNAEKYSLKLQQEGYRTLIISQANGLQAVTIGAFTTRTEALLSLNNIRSRHPEVWILEQ